MKKRKLNSTNPKYLTNSEKEATQVEYRKELIKEVIKKDEKGRTSKIKISALYIK